MAGKPHIKQGPGAMMRPLFYVRFPSHLRRNTRNLSPIQIQILKTKLTRQSLSIELQKNANINGTVGSKAKEDVVGTKLWDPRTSPLAFGQGMEGEGEDLETRFINGEKSRQEVYLERYAGI